MSIQSRHESRLLTAAEQELVAATRQPEIGRLSHNCDTPDHSGPLDNLH